jgi:hypothetical protein
VELGLSRFPVLHANAQFTAEGYFEACVGSGTFIARSTGIGNVHWTAGFN